MVSTWELQGDAWAVYPWQCTRDIGAVKIALMAGPSWRRVSTRFEAAGEGKHAENLSPSIAC
jgi:hypothetical protein